MASQLQTGKDSLGFFGLFHFEKSRIEIPTFIFSFSFLVNLRACIFKQIENKFWCVINIVAGALSKVCHAYIYIIFLIYIIYNIM